MDVCVVEARHMPDKERFSRQDPYVEIRMKYTDRVVMTTVKDEAGTKARWNQNFSFDVPESGMAHLHLRVDVKDKNIGKDRLIAYTDIDLNHLNQPGKQSASVNQWYAMRTEKGKAGGEIRLEVVLHKRAKEPKAGVPGYGGYPMQPGQAPYGYPPQAGYPPQGGGYPPAPGGYPPPGGYYPPPGVPPAGGYAPPGQGGYGPAPPGQGGYGQPPPGQGGYGQPPPGQGGYGPPPPGQGGYGPPPPGQGGYGQAPPQQSGYFGQQPPAQSGYYGAPPGQQPPGAGAPPPGQAPPPGPTAPPPGQGGYPAYPPPSK
ncbi:hypothetical protein NDN08_007430 [Rhodosorus marinus]|uniref:C2 domain-containing protein n=1 Tax=Rhodosorus marinus TaxID=101924 RepID=A0AAV8V3C6_9RHOD|nr:hypothetical protein NDN08_007430 [Rhodosorus marinus]